MQHSQFAFDPSITLRRAPRWWAWYVFGAFLLVGAFILPCVGTGLLGMSALDSSGPGVVPPGDMSVSVDKARRMVIWVDQPDGDTIFGNTPDVPDDLEATVTAPDGGNVQTRAADSELTGTTMNSERRGALVFDAAAAGIYKVSVKGTLQPTQTVAVSPDPTHKEVALGIGVVILVIIGIAMFVGGLVIMIVTGVRQSRYGASV